MSASPREGDAAPKPYYADDFVTLYNGDATQLLPSILSRVETPIIVSDPPYGIRYSPSQNSKKAWGNKTFVGDTVVAGDDEPFDPSPLIDGPAVLFGANHYADKLPPSAHWIVWDKRDGMPSNDFADCELVWTNLPGVARVFRHLWNGALRASERGEPRLHPTQKPLVLMRWLLAQCPDGTIIDPYAGSGTTLRAAKDLGRHAIGIELDAGYCAVAAQRCAQEVLVA